MPAMLWKQVFSFVYLVSLAHSLPTIHVSIPDTVDGHKLLGEKIGRVAGAQIRNVFAKDTELLAAVNNTEVQPLLDALIRFHETNYPLFWAEVMGLAAGSNLPLRLVAAANFRQELTSVIGAPREKCTDVHLEADGEVALAHNEDYGSIFFDGMYLLTADIGPERGNPHSFTAFCYPAVLPGWSVTLRSSFTASVNLLFPRRANPHKVDSELLSVVFALRDVISAPDAAAALKATHDSSMRYGYSLNLADLSTKTFHQIEVAPGGKVSEIAVAPDASETQVGAHANKYLRLPGVPEYDDETVSSKHRMARFEEMKDAVRKPVDLLEVLGDTSDKQWPLFRSGHGPDESVTLATFAWDTKSRVARVFRHKPDGQFFSPSALYWSNPLLEVAFPEDHHELVTWI